MKAYDGKSTILEYALDLATSAHKRMKRDTGEPYITHPVAVASILENLVYKSEYKDAAIAAAYLHDVVEDVRGLDVYDPFFDYRISKKNTLNFLLEKARINKDYICYIVNKLTFRKETSYSQYMDEIFTLSKFTGPIRSLDIIAALLKFCDRIANTIPDEKLNKDQLLQKYRSFKDADIKKLKRLYKSKGITDKFIQNGGIFYDENFFFGAMEDKFETKKCANALDNLVSYIPEVEKFILNGSSKVLYAWEGMFFDQKKLSSLIDRCLLNSFTIIENADLTDRLKLIHIIYRTAKYRNRKINKGSIHRLKALRFKVRQR
ncbi:MAG: HD domain-containing protein [Nanoarchaeota archaeon]|nr:HD domain-containing protein [Nanoarchaeota archaeon]